MFCNQAGRALYRDVGRRRILAVLPTDAAFSRMTVNQRLLALAQLGDVEVLSCYPTSFPHSVSAAVAIRAMPASSRLPRGSPRLVAFSVEVALWCLLQRVRRRRYEVVYAIHDLSAVAGWLLRAGGAGWVIDVLDDPALEMGNAAALGKRAKASALRARDRLFKALARRADLVLTIGLSSNDILPRLLVSKYAVEASRVVPLCQALPVESFPAPTPVPVEACRIFYVGWVSVLRGADTLLAAVRNLRSQGRNLQLRLAGPMKDHDERRLGTVIRDPDVGAEYLGPLSSEGVLQEIEAASVCVCPFPDTSQLRPVQPVKVLEYLAAGRPVVASRLPGIEALIQDGISGLLVDPGDEDGLANAVARLLDDPALAQKIADEARRRAANFSISTVNRRLAEATHPWL